VKQATLNCGTQTHFGRAMPRADVITVELYRRRHPAVRLRLIRATSWRRSLPSGSSRPPDMGLHPVQVLVVLLGGKSARRLRAEAVEDRGSPAPSRLVRLAFAQLCRYLRIRQTPRQGASGREGLPLPLAARCIAIMVATHRDGFVLWPAPRVTARRDRLD
jgi:hypothetical protein